MIEYDSIKSSFFEANKTYCEKIEKLFKELNIDYSGYCNCWGYNVESEFIKTNLIYKLKFIKTQNSVTAGGIPRDAIDYSGFRISVSGLNKKYRFCLGKSSFIRFFTPSKFKSKIKPPSYISYNYQSDDLLIYDLIKLFENYEMASFRLRNGKFSIVIHYAIENPQLIITELDKLIKVLA